jgi:integrase
MASVGYRSRARLPTGRSTRLEVARHRYRMAARLPAGGTLQGAGSRLPEGAGLRHHHVRRALQRQTWQHGCDSAEPCGRKRGADCPKRHGGGLVILPPKSRAGRRTVSLPPSLVPVLLEHRDAQAAERRQAGDLWQDNGWVFAQPNGKASDPRADYAEWKDVLTTAGVREARLHDARHTAATTLLVLQVPHRAVMDVMGWSKMEMAKRYQHVPDALRRNIAAQVDGVLWRPPDEGDEGAPVPA